MLHFVQEASNEEFGFILACIDTSDKSPPMLKATKEESICNRSKGSQSSKVIRYQQQALATSNEQQARQFVIRSNQNEVDFRIPQIEQLIDLELKLPHIDHVCTDVGYTNTGASLCFLKTRHCTNTVPQRRWLDEYRQGCVVLGVRNAGSDTKLIYVEPQDCLPKEPLWREEILQHI
ncbi:hypothetical protein LXL04_007571 [Taraxacum kok-saghyz]